MDSLISRRRRVTVCSRIGYNCREQPALRFGGAYIRTAWIQVERKTAMELNRKTHSALTWLLAAAVLLLVGYIVTAELRRPSPLPLTPTPAGTVEPAVTGVRSGPVRNVVLIIADGMGYPALGLLRSYARYAPESIYRGSGGTCSVERILNDGFAGMVFTEPYGVPVADSAASGSQIASGIPSLSESIGSDSGGNPIETVLDAAKRSGRATGLVTDTRITHATPASFAAHVAHRDMENEIAGQLIDPVTGADVMLSAGLRHFLPQGVNDRDSEVYRLLSERWKNAARMTSKRKDDRDLLEEAERTGGWRIVLNRSELAAAEGPRILGLFEGSGMPDGIRETRQIDDPDRVWPTLSEMALKALEVLDRDPEGFFLMVEAGQIDWAAHNNDAGQLLHEMLRLDRLIASVRAWLGDRSDTLVILVADHETGGLAITYTWAGLPVEPVAKPGSLFTGRMFEPGSNYGDYAMLDGLYRQTMSFAALFSTFRRLEESRRTPEALAELVLDVTGIGISPDDAARILQERPNPHYIEGDDDYGNPTIPDMEEDQYFYSNSLNGICGLLAQRTGIERNIA